MLLKFFAEVEEGVEAVRYQDVLQTGTMNERVDEWMGALGSSTAAVLWPPPSGYLLKAAKAAVAALQTVGWRNYVHIHNIFGRVCV